MTFTSLSDLYFFTAGLHGLNTVYQIASETKLILAPVITLIVSCLIKNLEGEIDAATLLKRLEAGIWLQFLVILIAFTPMVPLKLDGISLYTKSCEGYEEPKINNGVFANRDEVKEIYIVLSGERLKMPLFLALSHAYGTGFSLEAVDRLPCGINLQGVKKALLDTKIRNQNLLIETKAFMNECYYPALNRGLREKELAFPWIEDVYTDSQPWPGHHAFMNDKYYGAIGIGFHSNALLPGWQAAKTNSYIPLWINSKQEENKGGCQDGTCIHQVGGFPSCLEWWKGIGAGWPGVKASSNEMSLRVRLWEHLPEDTKSAVWPIMKLSYGELSRSSSAYQDKILEKTYFNQVSLNKIQGAEARDYGTQDGGVMSHISRLLGSVGNIGSSVEKFAEASIVQNAAPIIKGALMLVLLVIYPLAIIISQYSLKIATMLTVLYGTLLFWPYFWELTIVLQKSYIQAVASNSSIPLTDVLSNPNTVLNSQYVTDLLFLAFPLIFSSALSYCGLAIGGAIGSASGMNSAGRGAGSSGASVGGKVATKVASKGLQK